MNSERQALREAALNESPAEPIANFTIFVEGKPKKERVEKQREEGRRFSPELRDGLRAAQLWGLYNTKAASFWFHFLHFFFNKKKKKEISFLLFGI